MPNSLTDMSVTKAVIPAAGLGTRFLPATKAIPKELLPVVDRPALEYIVEEAARAGATDVLIITGRGKTAIEDHFDRAPEIEAALEKKGDTERLARVRLSTEMAKVHFVRQGVAAGLGHAVLVAAEHVGDEPFIVLLGDDMVDERDPLLEQMIAEQEIHGGSVMALMEVPQEMVSLYGVATVEPAEASGKYGLVRIRDLVEKPPLEEAPSNLAVIGRYLLSPTIFEILRKTEPGRGGEIQLTDAIKTLAQIEPVHGVVFTGRRYDTGDRGDYVKAVVRLACERADIGPELWEWLQEYVRSGGPNGGVAA
jgi:UTP--glucose-1-phosphate uridylyltransferase